MACHGFTPSLDLGLYGWNLILRGVDLLHQGSHPDDDPVLTGCKVFLRKMHAYKSHVYRGGNSQANFMANHACTIDVLTFREESFPDKLICKSSGTEVRPISGSNDHTTKFWCRNRPGDTNRDRYSVGYNQGYGEQNPLHSGRMMGGFPVPEPPLTPGPFAPGLSRNEGTIPGIGVAMPLQSLDGSDQGERQAIPGIMPPGAPPLPPGPHPSLLAPGQQQAYQQFPPQQQQTQQQQPSFPQQMVQHPLPPPNLNQMQPPSHLLLLQHPHLPRPPPGPPPQVQQLGMPAPMPSSMPGSMPMASTIAPMPLQNPMAMQGSANQMISPMPQGHMIGLNQMHSGPSPAGNIPPNMGGFPNGLTNIQGAPGSGGAQNFPMGSMFNRSQVAQLSQIPGLNTFQPGMMDGQAPGMGLGGGNMGLPPPPPPPQPQGSAPR